MTLTYDLHFQSQASYAHEHRPTHKTQVRMSIGSTERVETKNKRTDGQTDTADCFTFPANAVDNQERRWTRARR